MIVNKNENVYTDISGCIDNGILSEYFYDDIKRALSYYPGIIKKIMHGCDFCGNHTPLNNTEDYEKLIIDNFTKEESELILYKNAERLYKI
jgi:predicted TIM-barrel fold metal-dependent hydrolase